MLDSHPKMAIPPETGFFAGDKALTEEGNGLRDNFFHSIRNFPSESPAWCDFEIAEDQFWSSLMEIKPFNLADGYRAFYRLYAARFGKSRWGDKTPLYFKQAEKIRKVLPEARFIHLIRDGRDTALSLQKMWFSPGPDIETLAAYWRDCVLQARCTAAGKLDYIEVRYEDLILDTRDTLSKICEFIDLDYDDAMLFYYLRSHNRLKEHKGRSLPDGSRFLTQAERYRQQERTTRAPDPACVFAWKQTMSPEDRQRFNLIAGNLLRDLDYEV